MYAAHFGLERDPFTIAPDPRYLYLGSQHREALAHLLYGLDGGGGFVVLTGEVGAGKTTVCRCFLEQVPAHCRVAYVFNPKLTAIELLAVVCQEFGIAVEAPPHGPATIKTHVDPLNAFLLEAHAAGRQCVLVIDEAQQLSPEVLEQLRLLTNLETSERKLLQIILIGQPELRGILSRPGLAQLAQRVIARYHLEPLDEADTGRYVAHRLAVSGLRGPAPIGPGLIRAIHRHTGGVPRRINLLCDRALLGAYSQGLAVVDKPTLDKAAREVFWPAAAEPVPSRVGWAALAAGLVVIGLGTWWALLPRMNDARQAAALKPVAAAASRPANPLAASAAAASAVAVARAVPAAASSAMAPSAMAPSTGAAPQRVSIAELQSRLAGRARSEAEAWREMALLWGERLPEGSACAVAGRVRLQCYTTRAGLLRLRSVDRPALIVLRDGDAAPMHLVLVGLGSREAWFQVDGARLAVGLDDLSARWQGEFGTLWRTPEPAVGAAPPGVDPVLAQRLARAQPGQAAATEPAELRRRLAAFQMSQGLIPDGDVGALTQMMLNRAIGEPEPRLALAP